MSGTGSDVQPPVTTRGKDRRDSELKDQVEKLFLSLDFGKHDGWTKLCSDINDIKTNSETSVKRNDFESFKDSQLAVVEEIKVSNNAVIKSQETEIAQLKETLASSQAVHAALQGKIESIDKDIQTIKQDNTDNKTEIEKLWAKLKEIEAANPTNKDELSNLINSSVKSSLEANDLPNALKAKIDINDRMALIRGLPGPFPSEKSNIQIVTDFMSDSLKVNSSDVIKHRPTHVTFRNRDQEDTKSFLIATFGSKDSRNFFLGKARNLTDNNISLSPSLPHEYRDANKDIKARFYDLKQKFLMNEKKLQVRYTFNPDCSYSCSYRISDPTQSFSWSIFDTYMPKAISSPAQSSATSKKTPDPSTLKNIFKIEPMDKNLIGAELEKSVKSLLTNFDKTYKLNTTSGSKAYLTLETENPNSTLTLLTNTLKDYKVAIV